MTPSRSAEHARLARTMAQPRLLRLHRALGRLRSVVTLAHSGAHPDDEASALLAALRLGQGMRTVIICSTRGEGGQNFIGPERGGALALLRTREMELAARRLDADLRWVGHGPMDAVTDFGFSKDGDDTLRRWGHDRILERMVRAYRLERPDIVLPTFLDVGGQHGHHRAMTRVAFEAIALAADATAFPDQLVDGVTPWQVAKFYLPAWSGAGAAYDDDEPPPAATVTVDASGTDPATGATWDQIGEWSRAAHASQDMGHFRDVGRPSFPLHLRWSASPVPDAEHHPADGLPATLGALADDPALPFAAAEQLAAAQSAIDRAIAAFPDRDRILAAALDAHAAIAAAGPHLPEEAARRHGHRLARKRRELEAVVAVAAGLSVRAEPLGDLVSGGQVGVEGHVAADRAQVSARLVCGPGLLAEADGAGWHVSANADAAPTAAFTAAYDVLGGNGDVWVEAALTIGDQTLTVPVDLDPPLVVLPAAVTCFAPETVILRRGAAQDFALAGGNPALPAGWSASDGAIHPPADLPAGRHDLAPATPAMCVTSFATPHVGRLHWIEPAVLRVLSLDLAMPGGRVGWIAGTDQLGLWLQRMGADVTVLSPAQLAAARFGDFDTIVVGVSAFGVRPDLAARTADLHGFVAAGGHLLTLYHRPGDGWDSTRTPPRAVTIGTPSLRWRVTRPDAPVTLSAPDHLLLAGPNRITPADFDGWEKDRGLYFASAWDSAYVPLLATGDPGEAPLTGGLLSAAIGRGRHTHCALTLHHQLEQLIPGAIRLTANLIQPAGGG